MIETAVDDSVKGGIKFDYRIFREDGRTLLAEGFTKDAFVDRTGRVTRPPGFIRELMRRNAAAEPRGGPLNKRGSRYRSFRQALAGIHWSRIKYVMLSIVTHSTGLSFQVQVQPGASRNQILGLHGDALKLKLDGPAGRGSRQ